MRVWKTLNLYCSDEELEDWLNDLEREGKHIQEILLEGKFAYKIIYTIEETKDESNMSTL